MSLDQKTRLLEAGGSSALDWTRLDTIEEYSYKPLPKGSFTRAIELDQSRAGEEIYCKLRQIPYKRLGSCVFPYRVVSYAWGEQPKFTEKLWIQDEPGVYLPITKEIKQMLEALMDGLPQQKTCRLWVDAVCINQADLEERARQVTRMGDIYSSAEEVLVWLGDGPEISNSLGHISQLFGHTKHTAERWNLITDFNHDTKEQLKIFVYIFVRSPLV